LKTIVKRQFHFWAKNFYSDTSQFKCFSKCDLSSTKTEGGFFVFVLLAILLSRSRQSAARREASPQGAVLGGFCKEAPFV
jgi:hypothetical protein